MQELFNDPRAWLALAALVGLVFAVGRWVGEVNSDRKSFKEFMAETRRQLAEIHGQLGEIQGQLAEVHRQFVEVHRQLVEVHRQLAEVHRQIGDIFGRLPSEAVAGASPLRLTELGKRVSEAIDGRELAVELALGLLPQAEGKRPHQIARLCRDYVNDTFEPTAEQLDRFEAAAYEEGITRSEVFQVIAVELRDHLLSQALPAPQTVPA